MAAKIYDGRKKHVLHLGSYEELLDEMPSKSVDLVVSSPPYCIGKAYESARTTQEFRDIHTSVIPLLDRVLTDDGVVCWQVGYHTRAGELTPLDFIVHEVVSGLTRWTLRNRVVWHFRHGLHCKNRFSGRHEMILCYSKGRNFPFDLDAVRVPQRYPGKRAYKGENAGEYSSHPDGMNPSDVWDIPNVKALHVEKTNHPCQYPVALVSRLINAFCPPKGRVLDPFAGSFTTAIAAAICGRKSVSSEVEQSYYAEGVKRFEMLERGELKTRPDTPPLEPKGRLTYRTA